MSKTKEWLEANPIELNPKKPKIKIFSSGGRHYKELEDDVNAWIEDNNIYVIKITYHESDFRNTRIMVVYTHG